MFDTFNNRVVINIKNTAPYYTYLQIYRFNSLVSYATPSSSLSSGSCAVVSVLLAAGAAVSHFYPASAGSPAVSHFNPASATRPNLGQSSFQTSVKPTLGQACRDSVKSLRKSRSKPRANGAPRTRGRSGIRHINKLRARYLKEVVNNNKLGYTINYHKLSNHQYKCAFSSAEPTEHRSARLS